MNSYSCFSSPLSCPGATYCVGCIGGCALSLLGPAAGQRYIWPGGCTILAPCAAQPQRWAGAMFSSPTVSIVHLPCMTTQSGLVAGARVCVLEAACRLSSAYRARKRYLP